MPLRYLVTKIKRILGRLGSIGHAPSDNEELKSHKSIVTVSLMAAVLNLVFFAIKYIGIGRINAAIALIIFAIVLTLNIGFFRLHRNFRVFRDIAFIGFFFYMIAYHYLMGGYIGSVIYINYGIAVLVGIQMFYKKRWEKNAWFFIYMITAIILYFLEPQISKGMVPLSDSLTLLTHVNNFILISSLVILSVNYFTTIIKEEKQKSDILIRNILPESVVNELNVQGKYNPIMTPHATAIFMDFVNFTKITADMSPQDLVSILNEHFTDFDQIFKDHKVEKLKTIGDGYMAVGGLPEINNTHPLDVALAAMQILLYMETKNKNKDIPWDIRIGIHTGPMVAGIIGKTKFSYDVWGRSVNICSRLETASKPGCINVSEEFMELTQAFFEFEARGLVDIKSIGPTRMYFLTDIKEQLRTVHFQPNKKFYDCYEEFAKTPLNIEKGVV